MSTIKPFTRSHRINDPGYSVDVPFLWRRFSPLSEVWFYAVALQEMGRPLLFSLHLTPKTREQMDRSRLPAKDFIAKRFRDHLPGVPYLFVLEHSPNGVLHAHGIVSIAPDVDPAEIDNRLRKIAGDRRKLIGKEQRFFHDVVTLKRTEPDFAQNFDGRNGLFGWAGYCVKNVAKTKRRLGTSPISCSRDVSGHARRIHDNIVRATHRQPDVTIQKRSPRKSETD
jgi:hypothetical protein